MGRPKGRPARRWNARAEVPRDAEGFAAPDDVAAVAERLESRLVSRHPELRDERKGLWGARVLYVEEVRRNPDGSPVWAPQEEAKGYNAKLTGRRVLLQELRRIAHDAQHVLTGQTRRRSILGMSVYVYPDSSPWRKRSPVADLARPTVPHQPGQQRDRFGRFWDGVRVPKSVERIPKGQPGAGRFRGKP